MTKPLDIRPHDLAIVLQILQGCLPAHAKVWVFGSRAKWTTKDSSDLDLTIDAGRPLNRNEQAELADAFEESDLPYKVDIADWHSISESFKAVISADRVELTLTKNADWQEVNLKSVTSLIGDGLHGTPKYENNGDYYFINGNNLNGRKIIFSNTTKRCLEQEYFKYRKNLSDRTILVSINGTIGNVALYNNEKIILGKSACYLNVLDNVDKMFIFYIIKDNHFQNHITSLATGSTIKNVGLKLIRDYTFNFPPLSEQQAISEVLSALDDKIELNRQMNDTLEETARALFKSWFVNFDPVRAKMAGEKPAGLEGDLAALFPDRLVESPLGMIPEGWEVKEIKNLGSVICGKTPPTRDPNNYGYEMPFITIPDMHGKIWAIETSKNLSSKGILTQKNKILPSESICVSCIATPGLVTLTDVPSQTNQQINSLIPKNKNQSLYYYWIMRQVSEKIRSHGSGGSVFHNLSKSQFESITVVHAGDTIGRLYTDLIRPYFDRIRQNEKENQTLSQLRDALLPKLISGELRVGDITPIKEAV